MGRLNVRSTPFRAVVGALNSVQAFAQQTVNGQHTAEEIFGHVTFDPAIIGPSRGAMESLIGDT